VTEKGTPYIVIVAHGCKTRRYASAGVLFIKHLAWNLLMQDLWILQLHTKQEYCCEIPQVSEESLY